MVFSLATLTSRTHEQIISCTRISKWFGSHQVIRDFCCAIYAGERVGLVGAMGTGKSTLIKILMGTLPFDGGVVVSPKSLVVISHEAIALCINQSVADFCSTHSIPISLVLLDVTRPIHTLSDGEKAQLYVAQVYTSTHELVVLDGPTRYIDPITRAALIAHVTRSAQTFLMVSHDQEFLRITTTRSIEMTKPAPCGARLTGEVSFTNLQDNNYI